MKMKKLFWTLTLIVLASGVLGYFYFGTGNVYLAAEGDNQCLDDTTPCFEPPTCCKKDEVCTINIRTLKSGEASCERKKDCTDGGSYCGTNDYFNPPQTVCCGAGEYCVKEEADQSQDDPHDYYRCAPLDDRGCALGEEPCPAEPACCNAFAHCVSEVGEYGTVFYHCEDDPPSSPRQLY